MSLKLFNLYNSQNKDIIKWCTPSIAKEVLKVKKIYKNDISCSYKKFGNYLDNTGIFYEAQKSASKVFGADETLFNVNGSTGSNLVVLRALKKQLGNFKILASRNVHKSILVGIEINNIEIDFLPVNYNNDLQIFLPNLENDIVNNILGSNPDVLLLTNPTYEGVSINLDSLIRKIRKINEKIIIFIDEAWGFHYSFSSYYPKSAIESGADITVQSVHKFGSGLQQTSLIHWNKERISSDCVFDANVELSTTSPSYHLLASIDAAIDLFNKSGEKIISRSINFANYFRENLIKNNFLRVEKFYDLNFFIDPLSILIYFKNYSGVEIAKELEKNNIIVEKSNLNSIQIIMNYSNGKKEIDNTINVLQNVVNRLNIIKKEKIDFPSSFEKIKNPSDINDIEKIKVCNAFNKIAAENIYAYPPGIAIIAKGEIIKKDHINFLIQNDFLFHKNTEFISVEKIIS